MKILNNLYLYCNMHLDMEMAQQTPRQQHCNSQIIDRHFIEKIDKFVYAYKIPETFCDFSFKAYKSLIHWFIFLVVFLFFVMKYLLHCQHNLVSSGHFYLFWFVPFLLVHWLTIKGTSNIPSPSLPPLFLEIFG